MKRIPGLSFEKIRSRAKHSIAYVTELKLHLYAYVCILLGVAIVALAGTPMEEEAQGNFALFSLGFFFLCFLLEVLIRLIVETKLAPLLSVVPGLILLGVLYSTEGLQMTVVAIAVGIGLRLLCSYVPHREALLLYGCLLLDVVALVLRFAWHVLAGITWSHKALFLCLVVLTLATLQQLVYEKNQGAFPFHFFVVLGILLFFLPMKETPIDWSPVQRLAGRVVTATQDMTYRLRTMSDDSNYMTGYGSMDVTGSSVSESDEEQLVLSTAEDPYHLFTDVATGAKKKVARSIYLAGGKGVDKEQLVTYLQFLYAHEVTREQAEDFSRISKLDVEYAYLATKDEIAPSNALQLSSEGATIAAGSGDVLHKKGYCLQSVYLDIDYGSADWIALCQRAKEATNPEVLSYEGACAYMDELYNVDLQSLLSEAEYEKCAQARIADTYTDVGNTTDEMTLLAKQVISGAENDYDRCKRLENYLRQYPYSTNAVGGYDSQSTMATPEGMSDIANRFLFDSKEGYCVHYSAAMVMMLRSVGIPARVMQGYRYTLPMERANEYVVQAKCAHFWPEAYIEGAGWVPFEPTAAYATASAYTWHRGSADQPAAEFLPQNQAWYDVPTVDEEETAAGVDHRQVLRILVIVGGSILALLLILLFGTMLLRNLQYHFASPAERVLLDVERMKSALERKTNTDFQNRGLLYDYLDLTPVEYRREVGEAFALYYGVVYGDSEAVSAETSTRIRLLREKIQKWKAPKKQIRRQSMETVG